MTAEGAVGSLRVAGVQLACVAGEVVANVAAHVDWAERAGAAGIDLLVFPELSLTGYELDLIAVRPHLTVTVDDPRLAPLAEAAGRWAVTLVVGAPVWCSTGRVLAAMVFRPGCGSASVYAKTHLHGRERDLFTAGTGPKVVDVSGWRVGLAVCFDAAVPGHAATSRSLGADVYAVSALYTAGQERRLVEQLSARAAENGLVTVLGQHVGATGAGTACGGAGVWAADGAALVQLNAATAGLAVADLPASGHRGATECVYAAAPGRPGPDRAGDAGGHPGQHR